MCNFNLIISLVILVSINTINCTEANKTPEPVKQNEPQINLHLKWVTNQTSFPIKMSIPVNSKDKNNSLIWDWVRSTDQSQVSKLPDVLKNYIVSETESRASLYVLNYDNQTHEQLSGYEPKLILNTQNGPKFINNQRDLFALTYLKKHHIKAVKTSENIQVSCIADFLISNSLNEHSEAILRLMEKYASFKLAIRSANFPKKKIKSGKKTSDMFLFDSHNEKNVQKPNFPSPPPPPPQYQQPIHQQYQPINEYAQPQQPAYHPQNSYPQVQPQPIPPTFYNHQPIVNPFQAYHYFNSHDRYEQRNLHDEFVNNPHFNDMMDEYETFLMQLKLRDNAIGYPRFELKRVPQRTFVQPFEWNHYDDYYFRFKRETEEKNFPKHEETDDEDFDYDTNKFSKVRLSLGPVTIHKPFEKEEVVSCMLNLMNYDDVNLAHHSRIFKTIKTDEKIENEETLSNGIEKIVNDELIPQQDFKNFQKAEQNFFETDKAKDKEPIQQAITATKSIEKIVEKPATHLMFLTDKSDSVSFDHYFNGESSIKQRFSPLFLISSLILYSIFQF